METLNPTNAEGDPLGRGGAVDLNFALGKKGEVFTNCHTTQLGWIYLGGCGEQLTPGSCKVLLAR